MQQNYPRSEKLKNKKELAFLFEKGSWKSSGSLRIVFVKNADVESQKVGVSVSKKLFKRAVDRNRIKRLLRECYRLHKDEFIHALGPKSISMLFYNDAKLPESLQEIESQYLQLLDKASRQ